MIIFNQIMLDSLTINYWIFKKLLELKNKISERIFKNVFLIAKKLRNWVF